MGNSCAQNSQVNIQKEENLSSEGNYCINPELPITDNEIQLLKESWVTVSQEWNEICTMAFQRWFKLYPEIAHLFGTTLNNENQLSQLIKSHAIQGHANRFKKLIEKVLQQMTEIGKLSKTLIDYGKFHHSFGAEQKYATCLAISLKYGVCEVSKCDFKTANAWDSLFQYLAGMLKRGMRSAKEEEKISEANQENDQPTENLSIRNVIGGENKIVVNENDEGESN
ncbi:neuroglobin-like [Clytia hemisphaerica]|uniref:Globin domain-containing protein n=1 Tax=Clytia hemisphaerica TaxID=252671 RepID=A0A7M5UIU1_9CNID